MEKFIELSNLMFPDVNNTLEYLEIKYPERENKRAVTRFAPSPTGFLHTGGLFGAMVNRKIASQDQGIFFLRIEDTDGKREVAGAVKMFTDELSKFGLSPDEGVISENLEKGNYGPYVQSKRKDIYHICAKYLVSKGLAYPCFCTTDMINTTRQIQEKNKIVPGYYGIYAKCRNISVEESIERVKAGEKFIVRFRSSGSHLKKVSFIDGARGKLEMAENDQDIVLIKADGLPTYHFAHVCDDHFMRTTHVVRGEEWIPSTPVHIELFNAMGFKLPTYIHVPLIMVKDGESRRKLSKRKDKEAAVSYFIKSGYPTNSVIEYLMTLANSDFEMWRMNNKGASIDEFTFKLNKMSSSGSLLDMPKLHDICKEYIATLDSKSLLNEAIKWAKENNEEIYEILSRDLEYSRKMLAIERDNAKKIRKDLIKYEDILENFVYFFDDKFKEDISNGYNFDYSEKITKEGIKNILNTYLEIYDYNDDKETWFNKVKLTAEKLGFCTDMKEYKKDPEKYIGNTSDVATAIRIAITNRKNTPDIYAIMQVLGLERVTLRIKEAVDKI